MGARGKQPSKAARQERDQRIVTLFTQGSHISQLAERFGMSLERVREILLIAGCNTGGHHSTSVPLPSQWARSYKTTLK